MAGANGDVNGGLYFDGSRASAQLPSADAITAGMNEANDFSIAMWVNPEGAQQANARLVESSGNTVTLGGYRLSMAATVLEFRASNGLIMSGDTVTADTWNLVVLRYDALGVATLNVLTAGDAVDAAFVTGNSAISAASGDISYVVDLRTIFGVRNANTAENEFKGSMDDIMFFSGTLTDQEVSDMYTTVIPEPATLGLVAGMGGALLFIRRKLSM